MKLVEVEIAPGVKHIGIVDGEHITLDATKVIAATAQGILDARALYPDMTLADMYDEAKMPPEVRAAHELNDRAVMEAYGFTPNAECEEMVEKLLELHTTLAEGDVEGERKYAAD